jgi:hypothetical protein
MVLVKLLVFLLQHLLDDRHQVNHPYLQASLVVEEEVLPNPKSQLRRRKLIKRKKKKSLKDIKK